MDEDKPWSGNPNITREEAWEAHKVHSLPVPPAIADKAAALIAEGVPVKDVAKQLGYKESQAQKLVHSDPVQARLRKALEKAGIDDTYIANRLKELCEAKKTEFAKFKGQITDQTEVEDNGTRLGALTLAIDVATEFSARKQNNQSQGNAQFVIQLGTEFKNVFFPGSTPVESQNAQDAIEGNPDTMEQVQSGSDDSQSPRLP